VARDENIERIKKKESRIKEGERAKIVKGERIVDKVMLGDTGENYTVLEKVRPDIIAVGYDQKIPDILKNKLKKYKIVTLKSFHPEIYKSSKMKGPFVCRD